jgi:hypothetical protein
MVIASANSFVIETKLTENIQCQWIVEDVTTGSCSLIFSITLLFKSEKDYTRIKIHIRVERSDLYSNKGI